MNNTSRVFVILTLVPTVAPLLVLIFFSLFIYSTAHEQKHKHIFDNLELWRYLNIYVITQSLLTLFRPDPLKSPEQRREALWRWEGGRCVSLRFSSESCQSLYHMLRFFFYTICKNILHLIWKSRALCSSLSFFLRCILSISNLQISLFCFVVDFNNIHMTSLLSCA